MADPSTSLPPVAIAAPLLIFIALILDVPPFFWHLKHGNLAATILVFWISLSLFFDLLGSLIWPRGDTANWWKGYILCDIEVKLVGAWQAGIPGAVLCIMRSLSQVLDTEHTVLIPSTSMRRKQLAFDAFFCVGVPCYMIGIHYVVQPSRYYIYQLAGCLAPWDNSWPTIVLMAMLTPLISLGAVYYGGKWTFAPALHFILIFHESLSSYVHASTSEILPQYSTRQTQTSQSLASSACSSCPLSS